MSFEFCINFTEVVMEDGLIIEINDPVEKIFEDENIPIRIPNLGEHIIANNIVYKVVNITTDYDNLNINIVVEKADIADEKIIFDRVELPEG